MSRLLLGTALLTVAVLGCPKPKPQPGDFAGRPECPRDSIWVPADPGYKLVTSLAGPGPISLVPEYHDCQRMLNHDMNAFGPMIAVFARYGLDTMPDPTPPTGPPVRGRQVFAGDQAAATILNYDEPYDPLHIEHGFNCLYVYAVSGTWNAHIVKVKTDNDCLQPFDPAMQGFDLKVTVAPTPSNVKIPPVARWDWDKEARENYIGMRCGNRWCEISSSSHSFLVSSDRYTGKPTVEVKGWYDQQYLAVPANSSPDLTPGGVIGTIFPVGDLNANTVQTFTNTWAEVAIVSLSKDSPVYFNKFNFIAGPAPDGQTQIWFCTGTPEGCKIPNGQVPDCKDSPVKNDPPWFAKIVSADRVKYHCVIRRTHSGGIPIPGAVRWRWKLLDEGIWVACPEGCCEVSDK
jgi:hypothetical protein